MGLLLDDDLEPVKFADEIPNTGQIQGGFGAAGFAFEVAAQSPVPLQPTYGTLDHPTGGLWGEAAAAAQARGRFQPPAAVGLDSFGQALAIVAGVGED